MQSMPMFYNNAVQSSGDLVYDIAAAGFRRGDNLILHSSLKSVGRVEAGPRTVIDALLEVIGPAGNLLVPTFTYSLPGWKSDPFDINDSKARTGAIPEYVRLLPNSVRSFHPTHSVAVLGPDAPAITANHMDSTPLGIGSPFYRMLKRDAKILMLGTCQDTNSSLHLCEVLADLPYINIPFSDNVDFEMAWFHNQHKEIEFAPIREVPGCSRGFRAIEKALIDLGVLKTAKVGQASCQVLDMGNLASATQQILAKSPALLLCHQAHCAICPKRRAKIMGK